MGFILGVFLPAVCWVVVVSEGVSGCSVVMALHCRICSG